MNHKKLTELAEKPLPKDIYGPDIPHPDMYILKQMKKTLPNTEWLDMQTFQKADYHFLLNKMKLPSKKLVHKRKTFLSRNERISMGLLKLKKDGWKYGELEEMREMWRDYMRDNLDTVKKAPSCADQDWSNFSVVLSKSELIGAEVEVVRSVDPSMVGATGTIVLETKCTFQVVTPRNKLKILLKEPSVFVIQLDDMKFTIFGKHLVTRPSERSVKKIRTSLRPDI